ncbi:SSU ribosomal protein S20p [hydrothermal vent metagenome]|uniref:SSU ribosomal protein S20p n=1 Tax=hydrothermal vent metagenome TaxID=652676 RepID=A0A3B0TDZ1_9ZZZZ
MAHHKSALKRIRQDQKKRLHNKYYAKTTRNAIRELRNEKDKESAGKRYPGVIAMIDKLAKRKIIHKNKAANLKSKLTIHINDM